jgi:hypothetical protein
VQKVQKKGGHGKQSGAINNQLKISNHDPKELCGHSFSASAISGFNKKLDEELGRFARRELDGEYPYLMLDAR